LTTLGVYAELCNHAVKVFLPAYMYQSYIENNGIFLYNQIICIFRYCIKISVHIAVLSTVS